jgi:pimeloyl-ACP methyl ester carboxylesterase
MNDSDVQVRRGFVNVAHGQVHYRYAGHGPAVLLLHDSPRSSVMHTSMLRSLAGKFTAIAIDTPGYGLSSPLPATPRPEIPSFAAALAEACAALGIERCPVYGFHTSSKITLQYAIDHPDRVSLAIIDGLNLPPGGPSEAFIERYMKPFHLSDDGSHLAVAWAKGRDLFRFFPWFDKSPTARLPLDLPDDKFLHGYVLDMLMSREHYATAYSAAMRYLALPRVREVRAPTVFMCRSNDPLYPFLDALPADLPAHCSIERLGPDADAWRERVTALMQSATSTAGALRLPDPLACADHAETRGYLNLPQGQLHVRRYGAAGSTPRPCLVLPELPGSTAQTRPLCEALATDRVVYALDLPGIGESDALPMPDAPAYVDALLRALEVLGLTSVDIYARFTAAPLALELARQASNRVHALVLDGLPPATAAERRVLWKQYCPAIAPRWDGSHLFALRGCTKPPWTSPSNPSPTATPHSRPLRSTSSRPCARSNSRCCCSPTNRTHVTADSRNLHGWRVRPAWHRGPIRLRSWPTGSARTGPAERGAAPQRSVSVVDADPYQGLAEVLAAHQAAERIGCTGETFGDILAITETAIANPPADDLQQLRLPLHMVVDHQTLHRCASPDHRAQERP